MRARRLIRIGGQGTETIGILGLYFPLTGFPPYQLRGAGENTPGTHLTVPQNGITVILSNALQV